MAHSAHREVAMCLQQALSALAHLPETRERLEAAFDLRSQLRPALLPFEEYERMEALTREMAELADTLADRERLARVALSRTTDHWFRGEYPQGLAAARQALTVTLQDGMAALEPEARTYVGWHLFALGEYRSAMEELRKAAGMVGGNPGAGVRSSAAWRGGSTSQLVSSRIALALVRSLVEVGEFGAARTHAEQGFHEAEALNHPYSLAVASWGRGLIPLRQGDAEAAIRALERSFALCVEGNYGFIMPVIQSLLGSAYLLGGGVAEALPLLREAAAHPRPCHTAVVVALAEGCLAAGRLDEAWETAGRAVEVTSRIGERGTRAWGLRVLGEIASRRSPRDARGRRAALRRGTGTGRRPRHAPARRALPSRPG